MIIAIVDGGRLDVFNSETGKIVSGTVDEHQGYHPAEPDRRTDIVLGLLRNLIEKVDNMADVQDTVAAEVATLKASMVDLHTGVSGIQARLEAALAGAGGSSTDPTVLADLHGINDDLKTVVAALAPPAPPAPDPSAGATGATGATDPATAPQPVVSAPVVFDPSNTAPNAPGGRNSSQLPNFDPSVAETA